MPTVQKIVLVVDDDAAVRGALAFALEVEGFQVRLFSGSAALLADNDLPQEGCLVVDYRMPELDGLELVERVRARGVSLPILLISGRVSRSLRERAAQLGVDRVLEKPLSDAGFIESVRLALASPRATT